MTSWKPEAGPGPRWRRAAAARRRRRRRTSPTCGPTRSTSRAWTSSWRSSWPRPGRSTRGRTTRGPGRTGRSTSPSSRFATSSRRAPTARCTAARMMGRTSQVPPVLFPHPGFVCGLSVPLRLRGSAVAEDFLVFISR